MSGSTRYKPRTQNKQIAYTDSVHVNITPTIKTMYYKHRVCLKNNKHVQRGLIKKQHVSKIHTHRRCAIYTYFGTRKHNTDDKSTSCRDPTTAVASWKALNTRRRDFVISNEKTKKQKNMSEATMIAKHTNPSHTICTHVFGACHHCPDEKNTTCRDTSMAVQAWKASSTRRRD